MDPNLGQLSAEDQAAIESEFDRQLGITGDQNQPQLILGKFKDVEALQAAYVELERKQSQATNKQTTPKNTEPVAAKPDQKLEIGVKPEPETDDVTPNRAMSEYLQDMGEGKFDDTMRSELKQFYKLDDNTIDMMVRTAETQYQQSINEIVTEAGGQEALDQLSEWVSKTYTPNQIAEINQALKNNMLRGAVIRDLKSKMTASYNAPEQRSQEPTNLGVASTQGFATDNEMKVAMNDERYKNPQHPEHARYVDEVLTRFQNSPHLH